MEHLSKVAAELINRLDDQGRIKFIKQKKWIGYPQAKRVLDRLDVLRDSERSERAVGMLVVGESNNGKSRTLKHFLKQNPPYLGEDNELKIPVLYVESPPEPNEKRFYEEILDALCAPSRPTEKSDVKFQRVMNLLKKAEVRVLIIDEIHNIIAGSSTKQRVFLNVIKYISNKLQLPIVCAGTKDALNAISTDNQLSNRLPPYQLIEWTDNEDYLRLLASYELITPLKKASNLYEEPLASIILKMSEGLIGEINEIIQLAAEKAILDGEERITSSILANIDFSSPAERKRAFRQL
jgi:type II secretory pathway predicted ATPase ExeA